MKYLYSFACCGYQNKEVKNLKLATTPRSTIRATIRSIARKKPKGSKSQLHHYEEKKKYEQKIEAEIDRLKDWSSKAHREAGKVGKMAEMRTGVKEFYRSKAKKKSASRRARYGA